MKILAFLQSPSEALVDNRDEKALAKYRDDQNYHRHVLKQSMSGNRLAQSFGPLFSEIHWDNVAPLGIPDHVHVDKVVNEQKPDLILTFGGVAEEELSQCIAAIRIKVMSCHHPNARYRTQSDLDDFAAEVRDYILKHERGIEDEP